MNRGRSRSKAQEYIQKTIDRIIFVLNDSSSQTSWVIRYAANLSRMSGASVLFVCPAEYPMIYSAQESPLGPTLFPATVWEGIEEQAEVAVDEARNLIAQMGVKAEGRVLRIIGSLGKSVSEISNESDLIIVPKSKVHGLSRLFQKDSAADIVRWARCPVIVVSSAASQDGG
jgi:nucleotide-binding universal stress UspA family protein